MLPVMSSRLRIVLPSLAVFLVLCLLLTLIPKSPVTPYLKSSFNDLLATRPAQPQPQASQPYRPLVEIEGLKLGRSFGGLDDDPSVTGTKSLEHLTSTLLARYADLGVDTKHPICPLDVSRYASVLPASASSRSDTKQRVAIALNLYNSEGILPSLSRALLEMVFHVQPSHEIYISIFENASGDKTLPMLGELAAALLTLKVDGLFFRHSQLVKEGGDRIITLANIRNEAILPLLPYAADGTLLFINDVVCCSSDLLELVNQLRLQKAHAAMSTDWTIREYNNIPRCQFRDNWVMRGINGEMPYIWDTLGGFTPRAPTDDWVKDLFANQEPAIHQRWIDGKPVPVFSGWNGAIALDARIFTEYHVRFRASTQAHWTGGDSSGALGRWGELLATPGYLQADCGASECKLFCKDVWNVLEGHARLFVAPQSKTGYGVDEFEFFAARTPVTHRDGVAGGDELIDWSTVKMPHGVVCASAFDAAGNGRDPFGPGSDHVIIDPRVKDWQ